ncbi:MAG: UDP-N-acetylmuramoyl-L-alanine--D-glutamate ligase [Thermovirgaceae bacterium]|nr:UDP-N-acetylmuramoyl-L-alanine--D-glutamate ligase [Thermovirgaceae bacterium]
MSGFSPDHRYPLSGRSSVTVVGAGVSGRSLAVLARELGYPVFVTETREIDDGARAIFKKNGISFESGGHSQRMLECDTMVLSSGVSPNADPVVLALKNGIPIVGELDFVGPHLKGSIIGVTGSNGKTTTTMLAGHLFKKAGFKAGVAGNVGSPLAEHAGIDHEVIVAELSSFQLFWAKRFRLDLAVITNIEPDHIDWHGSLEEYFRSKKKILEMLPQNGRVICQFRDLPMLFPSGDVENKAIPLVWGSRKENRGNKGILMDEDQAVLADGGAGIKLFEYGDLPLLGRHNLENAAMSITSLSLLGGNMRSVKSSLASFKAPSHRCELVAVIDGVTYIDDSKGTNVAATVTALSSLEGKKIVILGGKGKGEDYGPLAIAVSREAAGVVLIGEEKPRIREALIKEGFWAFKEALTMKEAVETAIEMSKMGDVVLLSPACTSWDMYANYKERGDDFRRSVEAASGEQ